MENRWTQPISTDAIEVCWWQDGQGIAASKSARLLYWNGNAFVPVANARGGGVAIDRFNRTSLDRVTTDRLRLKVIAKGQKSTGMPL